MSIEEFSTCRSDRCEFPFTPPNGSAFSGVRQPGTAAVNASGYAILPRSISAQRKHVRCNGMLDGGRARQPGQHCEVPERLDARDSYDKPQSQLTPGEDAKPLCEGC